MQRKLRSLLVAASVGGLTLVPAFAATFGPMQQAFNVRVTSVFRNSNGPVYATFSPSSLTGCNGNAGGYLTASWTEAQAASTDGDNAAKMQVALLLAAKAADSPLEVRFRVNTNGSGWDRCTIDAIWLQ